MASFCLIFRNPIDIPAGLMYETPDMIQNVSVMSGIVPQARYNVKTKGKVSAMENKNLEVFRNAPVPKAVLKNVLPAMAAMVMVLIYNLAIPFLSVRRITTY